MAVLLIFIFILFFKIRAREKIRSFYRMEADAIRRRLSTGQGDFTFDEKFYAARLDDAAFRRKYGLSELRPCGVSLTAAIRCYNEGRKLLKDPSWTAANERIRNDIRRVAALSPGDLYSGFPDENDMADIIIFIRTWLTYFLRCSKCAENPCDAFCTGLHLSSDIFRTDWPGHLLSENEVRDCGIVLDFLETIRQSIPDFPEERPYMPDSKIERLVSRLADNIRRREKLI